MPSWILRLEGLPQVRVERPRIKSFLATLFGDVVSAHGGAADLRGLIRIAGEFGASERSVRTAVHRMARDGWLASERRGRTGYYRLSPNWHERFEVAQDRIYSAAAADRPNRWQVIIAPELSAAQRYVLHREMRWLGFVNVGGRTLVRVGEDRGEAAKVLNEVGLRGLVLVFDGSCEDMGKPEQRGLLRRFAQSGWDLRGVERRYAKFLAAFSPLADAVGDGAAADPSGALKIRLLLIHEFRRALLHDPCLPPMLLPTPWSGDKARELCARLYRQAAPASLPAVHEALRAPGRKAYPRANKGFSARFRPPPQAAARSGGRAT